jgi:hypothetical protein
MDVARKKKELIARAVRDYEDIMPCAMKNSLDECFTVEREAIYFWFNTRDHTTRIIKEPVAGN